MCLTQTKFLENRIYSHSISHYYSIGWCDYFLSSAARCKHREYREYKDKLFIFTIVKNLPIVIRALLSSERFDQFGLSFICLYIVRTIAESLCFFVIPANCST